MVYPLFLVKLLIRSGIARLLPRVQRHTRGGAAFLHYYSDRVLAAPYSELCEAAKYLEAKGPGAIDLAQGAPCFDLVPSGSTKLPADRRGWPPPYGLVELRAAVAEKLQDDHGLRLGSQDEILITQGAAGAFHAALDTFVNPGDRVVLFDPASPLFAFALRQRRARIRWLTTWMENGRTRFHLDQLDAALRGARLIVLNSPANPTGGVLAPQDLEQIAWWADRRDVLIFSDEVFARQRYEGDAASIAMLSRARRRTLTVSSVSKAYGLAAARVGWMAGHRHLIGPCAMTMALQSPFVPTVCQQIALAALRQHEDVYQPAKTALASRRRYAYERLQGLGLKPAWPAGAFFLWVPVQELGLSGRQFAQRLSHTKKVLVTPGDPFGPSGPRHIRLSYATEDGRLREGLGRLAEFVRELQATRREQLRRAA